MVIGQFRSQAEAERAYNAARGLIGSPDATIPAAVRPEDQNAPMFAPCGHGEPAPVVGGYWKCVGGYWYPTTWDDPAAQADPPRPAPGTAPVSPESSLPPHATSPGAAPARVIDADTIAAGIGVTRRELYALVGIAAAVIVLR